MQYGSLAQLFWLTEMLRFSSIGFPTYIKNIVMIICKSFLHNIP